VLRRVGGGFEAVLSEQAAGDILPRMSAMSYLSPWWNDTPEKPSSLPRNWPKPTAKDIEDCPQREIEIGVPEQPFDFSSNFVKTSKYEIYNFLPKFLLEEFNPMTKLANCYFLMISMMQCIPPISNTAGLPTTLIPLTFVVVVDGVFQVLEDLTRHRADREANSSVAHRYDKDSNRFVDVEWSELNVGDFVQVMNWEAIPADLVIVGVCEPTDQPRGLCYVETKSLDGETNLKLRSVVANSVGMVRSPIDTVTASCVTSVCFCTDFRCRIIGKSDGLNYHGAPQ
jgi:magnesium-transporting ATPase (P-type)